MNDDLANALEAASNDAGQLEALLLQNGNIAGAQDADQAQRDLLNAAALANNVNAMQKLATTTKAQQNLQKLVGGMNEATSSLATDESNLTTFVTLGTTATKLATALAAPINVANALSAVQAMISELGL
jgi:hypothetical protein